MLTSLVIMIAWGCDFQWGKQTEWHVGMHLLNGQSLCFKVTLLAVPEHLQPSKEIFTFGDVSAHVHLYQAFHITILHNQHTLS